MISCFFFSTMNSGMLRAQISAILEDEDFSLGTVRMKLAREAAKNLLELSSNSEESIFDDFATALYKKLQPTGSISNATKRRKLWKTFHAVRCESEFQKMWHDLYVKLGVKEEFRADCLLWQYVTEKLFETIVNSKTPVESAVAETGELNSDECNALRYVAGYVAGYVPFCLIKKFTKSSNSHPFKSDYLLCLKKMSEEEGDDESFLAYTKRWLSVVDRGGLFNINDDVYIFF